MRKFNNGDKVTTRDNIKCIIRGYKSSTTNRVLLEIIDNCSYGWTLTELDYIEYNNLNTISLDEKDVGKRFFFANDDDLTLFQDILTHKDFSVGDYVKDRSDSYNGTIRCVNGDHLLVETPNGWTFMEKGLTSKYEEWGLNHNDIGKKFYWIFTKYAIKSTETKKTINPNNNLKKESKLLKPITIKRRRLLS